MGMKGSTPAASTIIFVFILDTIKKCSCKLYDDGGMLTVYRHNPVLCKSTDRCYKRCTCPTWVEGMVGDKYVRHSLKTRSWGARTVAKVRKMDAEGDPNPAPAKKDEPVTIERAVNEYLADAKARELGEATLYKLNIIFRKQLLAWSKAGGYKLLCEFDLRAVQAYRATWKMERSPRRKSKNALPASSGSAFVLDGSLRTLRMAWAASL